MARQLTRGSELLDDPNLSAEKLEIWNQSLLRLSRRLSDALGDPVRNQVRRVLDGASIPLDGVAIEILRIQFGYGYREIARLADVSLPTVTRTIEGDRRTGPGVAKALADVWHLGVLELFDLDMDSGKLSPRTVEGLLEAMKASDDEAGSADWIRSTASSAEEPHD